MRWHHRPALDGLRTLAVYAVLLYHCGVSVASGGFIGVDLFFVLSGFLVTSVLLTEMHNTGRIRIARFYARRVRRLLPAALVVVLATSALFAVITSVAARLSWAGDARAALLYVSNWRFISAENDYFGADTSRSPFLHFWSLSIEEQFYLVLPLLLVLLFRLRKRWYPAVLTGLLVLLVASIGLQVYWGQVNPTHAYYGTDARIYQLLLGALAALVWRESVLAVVGDNPQREPGPLTTGDRVRGGAAWLLCAALVLAGSSVLDVAPTWRGLLAAFLSLAVVWALTDEWSRSLTRLFSLPTLTYLGRISYGTYLWHWPLVLAFGLMLDTEPWILAVIVGLTATGLAALSHQVLESPIRRPSWLDRRPLPTVAAGVSFSIVLAVGIAPWLLHSDGKPQLAAGARVVHSAQSQPVPSGIDWAGYAADRGLEVAPCSDEDSTTCVVHEGGDDRPRVMLVGDSHARQIAPLFKRFAEEHDFTLAVSAMGGCQWLQGVQFLEAGKQERFCPTQRDQLYDHLITDMDIDVVVLSQMARDDRTVPVGTFGSDGVKGDYEQVAAVTTRRTLDRLDELGVKTVVLESTLLPVEAGIGDPLDCLAGAEDAAACAVPAPKEAPVLDAFYRTNVMGRSNQKTVGINPIMCPAWPVCSALDGDVPVWRDGEHHTTAALMERRKPLWKAIAGTGFFDR